MEWVAQNKVKCTHKEHTLRNPLNINLNINKERQECEVGTVCVYGGISRKGES
jgi:hypothetical protein